MLGNLLKGTAVCATLGLACVGAMTLVPDQAWESFPPALSHVRARLAQYGIAPLLYREQAEPSPNASGELTEPNAFESRGVDSRSSVVIGPRRRGLPSSFVGLQDSADASREEIVSIPTSRFTGASTLSSSSSDVSSSYDESDSSFSQEDDATSDPFFAEEPIVSSATSELSVSESEEAESELVAQEDAFIEDPSVGLDNILVDRAVLEDQTAYEPLNSSDQLDSSQSLSNAESDALSAPVATLDSFPSETTLVETLDSFPSESSSVDVVESSTLESESVASFDSSSSESSSDVSLGAASAKVTPPATMNGTEETSYVAGSLNDCRGGSDASVGLSNNSSTGVSQPVATVPVATTPVAEPVQSFEDYARQSSITSSVPSSSEQSSPQRGYIASVPASEPSRSSNVDDLNTILQALSQPRTESQTRELFLSLNRYYSTQYATASSQDQANALKALDYLAFQVFYDAERNILETPRVIRQGDAFATLAIEYNVTPEFLAGINGLNVDAPLQPGSTIKVVRGPVEAEISSSKRELTLKLNGLYAGRFKCGIPQPSLNVRGKFLVSNKFVNPPCDATSTDGKAMKIPGGDPRNPLGACWIGLQNGPGLQGTNRPELVQQIVPENGGFIFSNQEISQLNAIMPIGATVAFVD